MALVEPIAHWNSVEGPGWIGTNGSMGAPGIGDPVGLLPDVSQWGSQKQAAFIAGQADRIANGGNGFSGTSGWEPTSNASLSEENGALRITNSSAYGEARATIATQVGVPFRLRISLRASTVAQPRVYIGTSLGGTQLLIVNPFPVGVREYIIVPTTTTTYLALRNQDATVGAYTEWDQFSIKDVPGNLARAGTWPTPSDTARPTRGDGFLNYNASNNYFSLLNPVPLADIGAIIHVCERPSTGIVTAGTGKDGSFSGSMWYANNRLYHGIRDTWLAADANLFTGPLVFTNWIDGTDEVLRVNGVEVSRVPVGPRTSSLHFLGRSYTYYHNGPQHAVQHLPPGVDLAMIQAWEAYGRTLNGAVFP